ncbi:MAG: NusG domain II-containing protein [Clostridia bacterium]|nr:NusG domain II-containing protein [Clostridia bacterium]
MKAKHWVVLFGGILLLCLCSILVSQQLRPDSLIAEIYQDEVLVETVDLNALTEPREIRITADGKENVVLAEPGQISMHSANCPDRLCVRQGAIHNGVYPIVCLPNKVVIKLKSSADTEADTVTN